MTNSSIPIITHAHWLPLINTPRLIPTFAHTYLLYTHACTHLRMHSLTYPHSLTQILVLTDTLTHTCPHIHTPTLTHTYRLALTPSHMLTLTKTPTSAQTLLNTPTHSHTHILSRTSTCLYTCTHAYIHTRFMYIHVNSWLDDIHEVAYFCSYNSHMCIFSSEHGIQHLYFQFFMRLTSQC